MAAKYEYWTAVFGVGLDGYSDFRETDIIESFGQQEVTAI